MPPSPSKPKSRARIEAYLGGHRAETLAAWFLRLKLYRVVQRRYKTPVGEIDLIAERFGTTVFVEVKARSKAVVEAEALQAVNRSRSRAGRAILAGAPSRQGGDEPALRREFSLHRADGRAMSSTPSTLPPEI